jgi:hypothetical protein
MQKYVHCVQRYLIKEIIIHADSCVEHMLGKSIAKHDNFKLF